MEFRNSNRPVDRGADYFRWRYESRPCDTEAVVIMATDGAGRILGSLSVIPHHYSVRGRAMRFGVVGDISVCADMRGQGIGRGLIEHIASAEPLRELGCHVVLPNQAVTGPLEKAGWRKVSAVERYLKVLDADHLLKRKLGSGLVERLIAGGINRVYGMAFDRGSVPDRYSCAAVDNIGDDFDRLWEEAGRAGWIMAFRDRAHLDWRYLSHPLMDYRIFGFYRDGLLAGYAVHHTVEPGVEQIDDLLWTGGEKELRHMLLLFLRQMSERADTSVVYLKINERPQTRGVLRRMGFFKRDRQDLMIKTPDPGDSVLSDGTSWHVTAGDKDV